MEINILLKMFEDNNLNFMIHIIIHLKALLVKLLKNLRDQFDGSRKSEK